MPWSKYAYMFQQVVLESFYSLLSDAATGIPVFKRSPRSGRIFVLDARDKNLLCSHQFGHLTILHNTVYAAQLSAPSLACYFYTTNHKADAIMLTRAGWRESPALSSPGTSIAFTSSTNINSARVRASSFLTMTDILPQRNLVQSRVGFARTVYLLCN